VVLLSQSETGENIPLLVDIVGLQHGGKDGETVGRVERYVKVVSIDTSDFLFREEN